MARRGVVLVIALTVLGAVALARPAAGQGARPPYPGPTSTVPGSPSHEQQNGGRVAAGETAVIESCGFSAAGSVDVSWNGEPAGVAVVGAAGCASVSVSVNGRDEVPPCPAAKVNGVPHEGRRGRNDLVVSGEGANGAARTVATHLSISCSNGGGGGGAGRAEAGDATVAGDRGVRVPVRLGGDTLLASASRSPVARWTALPLLFAVIAGLAVAVERRRRARRAVL